jgi:hypothetical protein
MLRERPELIGVPGSSWSKVQEKVDDSRASIGSGEHCEVIELFLGEDLVEVRMERLTTSDAAA